MNLKKKNYFNSLSLFSFLKVHRKILKEISKVSHPRLTHAIENYRFAVQDLQEVVKTPYWLSTAYGNNLRREAYKSTQKMLNGLAKMHPEHPVVTTLNEAFTDTLSYCPNAVVDNIITHAAQVAATFKPEDLKDYALDAWIPPFLEAVQQYDNTREAKEHNVKAENNATVKQFKRNCSVAFKCALDMVEIRAAQGDASCKEFLGWFKGI